MAIQHIQNEYHIPRARLLFNPFDASGNLTGEQPFGNCPTFNISTETQKSDHYSSESGLRVKDASVTVEVNRTANITCDNISPENLARFLSGSLETITQSAGSKTETLTARAGRHYQLGATASNPAGVRNISALTVEIAADAWEDETDYAVGAVVKPTTGTDLHAYRCITAGKSGISEPTWPVNGSTVTDGTATWEDIGEVALTSSVIASDLQAGRLQTLATFPADPVPLTISYTTPAVSWQRIKTGTQTALSGALRAIADNASGSNRDYYMPRVNLSPNGELPIITSETDFISVSFSAEILSSANQEAIYVDGRPLA
ncbi:hypothetical protein [Azonexus sp.]|uniref:phage tail tube protein n=1 Tax=Azonexus sp. TaxID=1872668 RepID=UPI0039E2B12C